MRTRSPLEWYNSLRSENTDMVALDNNTFFVAEKGIRRDCTLRRSALEIQVSFEGDYLVDDQVVEFENYISYLEASDDVRCMPLMTTSVGDRELYLVEAKIYSQEDLLYFIQDLALYKGGLP